MGSGRKRANNNTRRNNTSYSGYTWFVCTLLAPLAVILIGYYVSSLLQAPDTRQESQVTYHARNVTRKRILSPSSPSSYRDIAESREPLIVTNSIVNQWKAREFFTTNLFADRLSSVSVYTQQTKQSFITFHDNKPLEELVVGETWGDYNVRTNVSIAQLLRWSGSDSPADVWRYYSQEVTQLILVFPDILDYIQPLKPLVLDKESLQVNLWIGRRGIITHTHYDATYNFFLQLQGRKRFTLYPPNQPMYLYPCLHPHYGHSQVDILEPDLQSYPLFRSAESVVAVVSPGDMLVVPPYWYHHVETMEESVSVNVWSDAPEYDLMNRIYGLPIPLEATWTFDQLAIASCVYIRMILEGIEMEEKSRSSFLQDYLIEQRYRPLISSGKLITNDSCSENLFDLFSNTDPQEKMGFYSPLLEKGVANLSSLFNQISDNSIAIVCVGNYVEHLLHRSVGIDCLYGQLLACSSWK